MLLMQAPARVGAVLVAFTVLAVACLVGAALLRESPAFASPPAHPPENA